MPSHKKKKKKKTVTGSVQQRCRVASTDGKLKPQSLLSVEKQRAQQRPADMSGAERGMGFLSLLLGAVGSMREKMLLWGETNSWRFGPICDCQGAALAWGDPTSLTVGG